MCVCVCKCVHVCVHVYVCVHVCVHVYVYVCECMCVCVCVCVCVTVCVCMLATEHIQQFVAQLQDMHAMQETTWWQTHSMLIYYTYHKYPHNFSSSMIMN